MIPVIISTALVHIPMLMMEIVQRGFPFLRLEMLIQWSELQAAILLGAALLTSAGWFCTYCIQSIFED